MPGKKYKVRRGARKGRSNKRWYNGKFFSKIAKGSMSVAKMAASAYFTAKALKKADNIEYKIYDVSNSAISPDYNGTSVVLNNPAQGSTDTTRIGDSIKCQNLVLRGSVSANITAGTTNLVRLILIWDTQNQYSTLSDLLEVVGSLAVFSPKNYDRRFRNKVLWDRTFCVSVSQGQATIPFDEVFSLNDHTQFSAGTTTQFSGSLRLVMVSDKVTSLLPSVNYYSRLSFTDN